jgi:hypothetical protein
VLIVRGSRAALGVLAALLVFASTAKADPWRPVPQSCVSLSGSGGACAVGRASDGLWKVAVAPNGVHAYGIAYDSQAIMIFDRSPGTGQLTQRGAGGCLSESGSGCAVGRALSTVNGIVISPDGASVYVSSGASITAFDRNGTTGDLTQKPGGRGCFTADGSYGGTGGVCTAVPGLLPSTLLMSPDGRQVYVGPSGVTVLARDTITGDLSPASCVNAGGTGGCTAGRGLGAARQMSLSPDGRSFYLTSSGTNTIGVYDRDPSTGALRQKDGAAGCVGATATCTPEPRMSNPLAVLVSPDNRNVYVSVIDGMLTYARAGDGSLALQSCINDSGSNGCSTGRNLNTVSYSAISPDGQTIVAGLEPVGVPGIVVLDRDGNGNLSQPGGVDGCVTIDGSAIIHGSAVPGQCGVHPGVGGDGQMTFVDDANFIAGGYFTDSAVNFKRDLYPQCQSQSFGITQNVAAPLPFACSDRNGDAMTYAISGAPLAGALGAIDQGGARVFYNPFSDYLGADSVRYRATSTGLTSNEATMSLSVVPRAVPPAKPRTVTSRVPFTWSFKGSRFRIAQMLVRNLPAGGTVTITCSGKKCPFKSRTAKRGKSSTLNVVRAKTFKGRLHFRAKQTVEIRVAAPGMNAKVLRFKLKSGKTPKYQTYCIPLGKKKVQRTCG